MKQIASRHSIPISLAGLAALLAALLWVLPPERTLGHIIKVILLHGALVQTGLIAFAAAGLLGLAGLARSGESLYRWCLAAQKAALGVWVVYALSSVVSTYLAWGVAIAWNEPRVQASAQVLAASVAFLILTLWVRQRHFTAAANVMLAALAWVLVKGAILVRHPFDPVGDSNSVSFRWLFVAIQTVVLLIAIQVARWLHDASAPRDTS